MKRLAIFTAVVGYDAAVTAMWLCALPLFVLVVVQALRGRGRALREFIEDWWVLPMGVR